MDESRWSLEGSIKILSSKLTIGVSKALIATFVVEVCSVQLGRYYW